MLDDGCRFLAFDESSESAMDVGSINNPPFYEDPTLELDEQHWQQKLKNQKTMITDMKPSSNDKKRFHQLEKSKTIKLEAHQNDAGISVGTL